jgi:drug/metabolite transporter (DMT)-like permease
MLAPLIASITQAFGVVIDKVILSQKQVPINKFIPLLFSLLALFTFLILPFDSWCSEEIVSWSVVGYLLLMIGLAFSWNILYYRAIRQETIQEFEPILMLSPLVVILLAPIFYLEERNSIILSISLIVGVILVLSHLERGSIKFKKESLGLLACIFLAGLEVLVVRKLLFFFAPTPLYLIRCSVLFLIFLIYFRTNFARIDPSAVWGVVITSLLGVAQMVARFYGYQNMGIVFTTLVLSLSPVLVYLLGFLFLKEKIQPRKLVGGALILAGVTIAVLLN